LADVPLERRPTVAKDPAPDSESPRGVVIALKPFRAGQQHRTSEFVVGDDAVLALRRPARCGFVCQRSLQRELPPRPLILHVEAVVENAVARLVGPDALR